MTLGQDPLEQKEEKGKLVEQANNQNVGMSFHDSSHVQRIDLFIKSQHKFSHIWHQ